MFKHNYAKDAHAHTHTHTHTHTRTRTHTHTRLKNKAKTEKQQLLFIWTRTHNLQIFGLIPFVKLQNDT